MQRCPGQDTRYWRPEDVSEVECGGCGEVVEFFKTDGSRRCPGCGLRVVNPAVGLGCAQWCDHARACLGFDPAAAGAEGEGAQSVADALIEEVKAAFGEDRRRIAHALRVLDYAERMLAREGGEARVVIAAALMHDIGIKRAEEVHGSPAARFQEIEGPPIAREILSRLGLGEEAIEHVCRIVGSHHSAGDIDTPEFRIVWDADWLVNIPEEFPDAGHDEMKRLIDGVFRTETGAQMARALLLRGGS